MFTSLAVRGGAAAPDDKKVCMTAFESSQQLRKEGKLRAAQEQFSLCARSVCPKIIQTPCKGWLSETEQEIPSLTVMAVDEAGNKLPEAKLTIDGTVAQVAQETPLDPGSYAVRVEASGRVVAEQRVELASKEKGRKITLTLEREKKAAPVPTSAPPAETVAPRRISPAVYALGGVGLLGLGAFTYFGLSGRSEEGSLKDSCSPRCSPDQIDKVSRRYLFADISLGVGVVALGAATWLALSRPPPSPTTARVGVGVGPQGASVLVSKGF